MRIHGLLSFYDESPNWLSTTVTGFSRFCDSIIAVDGAYALYPGGKPRSHPLEVEAIVGAAEASNVGCIVYQPSETWRGNEVQKRSTLLDLAGVIATDGDWLCVFDADYQIRECNPEVLRAELEHTAHDVASYALYDGIDEPRAVWTTETRDIYRWHPGIRIGPTHASYSLGERWFRGPPPGAEMEEALELSKQTLTVYHRQSERSEARKTPKAKYHKLVDQLGIETEELVHG